MDKTSSSSFRVTAPAEGPPPPAEPGAPPSPGGPCVQQPKRVKARLLPVQASEGALDAERIGKGALATALGQGSCFGSAFALVNFLITKGKAYPFANGVMVAVLPPLTGYITAWAQRETGKALDYRPTQMPQDSLPYYCIPSASLYMVNISYARSKLLPKPTPGTPGAAGVTLMLSMLGTGLSGAISEVTAQWAGGKPGPLPDDAEVHRKGLGRAASLLPAGAAYARSAAYLKQQGKIPDDFKKIPFYLALAGFPWATYLAPKPPAPVPGIGTTSPTPDEGPPHDDPDAST